MGGCYKVKMRSAVCIACQRRIRQTHTFARFFLLHSKFFFLFLFSTHGFDFPPAQRELNQPPTVPSLSLFLFLHVQYCTLIAFQAPLRLPVFQLQSLLALPSFVSSKLSLHLSRLYSNLFSPLLHQTFSQVLR